jgi:hypothetical protein
MKPALLSATSIVLTLVLYSGLAPRASAQPSAPSDQNPPPTAAQPKAHASPGLPNMAEVMANRRRPMNELVQSGQASGMMGSAMGMGTHMGMGPMMTTGLCPSFAVMPSDPTTQAQWMQTCGKSLKIWGEWMEKRGKELEPEPK